MDLYKGKTWTVVFVDWCQEFPGQCIISSQIEIHKAFGGVVPEIASFEQQGKINVFKVVNDTAVTTMLDVEARVDNMLIVKNGIKEGDRVVVSGIGSLRNRTAIQPKNVNLDSVVNSITPVF